MIYITVYLNKLNYRIIVDYTNGFENTKVGFYFPEATKSLV